MKKVKKEISDTLEKLEAYNSQQNDLQNFDDMLRGLDGAMRQIQETEGNFSSDTTEKLMSEGTFASIVGVAKMIAGYTGKAKKRSSRIIFWLFTPCLHEKKFGIWC